MEQRHARRCSSAATARGIAGGDRPSARAAATKLRQSATATNAASLSTRSIIPQNEIVNIIHRRLSSDLGAYYAIGRIRIGADVLNLFDARDADISYFYASRLQGEAAEGVEDRHIHPVEPRQVRVSLTYRF